ncbi:hypothetical protein OOK31_36430 [Streptomyces sp. NBC_00249]|uniref:hypothetical protein n=1 Tax=Streptomyces sp. NBC_00249 TaxID=2975690 RepID=UPI00224FA307|nr:hypothetical protein [Streptomyces sp. NBC_00249]MCX5199302.1 hypothetical protein [Streptomyces sp. NBC_00249]
MAANQLMTEDRSMTTTRVSCGDPLLFEGRFGDLIDDRVAEALDELLGESLDGAIAARLGRYRKRDWPLMVLLVAVVSGLSVVLVDHPGAVATLWVAAAVICACRTRFCRPYEPGR